MSKMKIYELAKELNKSSKELVEFLAARNIEVKSHMSSIEEDAVTMVKKAFGGHTDTAKVTEDDVKDTVKDASKKEEAPKKKNIVHVFRPQNSRDGAKAGNRQNGRPGQRPAGTRPAGERPAGARAAGERPAGARPVGERPAGARPVGERPAGTRPAEEQGTRPVRNAEQSQENRPSRPQGDRNQSDRPQGDRN